MGRRRTIGKRRDRYGCHALATAMTMAMMIGDRIEDTGTLVRDGGGFALRRDDGGTVALDLHRVPVDHVEKHVRIAGLCVAPGLVEVDAIRAA